MDLSFLGEALSLNDFAESSHTIATQAGLNSINRPPLAELMAAIDSVASKTQIRLLSDPPALRNRKIGKFIYLPVEFTDELPRRAQLAGIMAKRGFQVVLGSIWNMSHCRWGDLAPGIVVFNSINAADAGLIFKAASAGHLTVCAAEETDPDLIKLECDRNSLKLIDHVFTPSNTPTYAELTNKVTVTWAMGAPCRPKMITSPFGFEQEIQTQLKAWAKPANEAIPALKRLVESEYEGKADNATYSPTSIPEALEGVWRRNQYDMPFNVIEAWDNRKSVWQFDALARARFDAVDAGIVEDMVSHPVKRLDQNIWALMPEGIH